MALTGPWTARRIITLVAVAALGGAVAFFVHVQLLGGQYQGTQKVPADAPVVSSFDEFGVPAGGNAQGVVFWFLATALAGALVTRLVLLGPSELFRSAVTLPGRLRGFPSRLGPQWPVALWLGIAAGIVLGGLLIPANRAVLGLGMLLIIPLAIGGTLVSIAARLSLALIPHLDRRVADPGAAAGTWLIGFAAGMLLAALVSSIGVRLGLALLLVALSVYRVRRGVPARAILLVVPGAVGLDWLMTAAPALADDGGYVECQIGLERSDVPGLGWLIDIVDNAAEYLGSDCAGVEEVRDSAEDAVLPGAGGAGAGSAAAGVPPKAPKPPPSPPDDLSDEGDLGQGPTPPAQTFEIDEEGEVFEIDDEGNRVRESGPRKTPPDKEPPPDGPETEIQQHADGSTTETRVEDNGAWDVIERDPDGHVNRRRRWDRDGNLLYSDEYGATLPEYSELYDPPGELRQWSTTSPSGRETDTYYTDPDREGGVFQSHQTTNDDGGYTIDTYGLPGPDGPAPLESTTYDADGNVTSHTDHTSGEGANRASGAGGGTRSGGAGGRGGPETPDLPDPPEPPDTPDW